MADATRKTVGRDLVEAVAEVYRSRRVQPAVALVDSLPEVAKAVAVGVVDAVTRELSVGAGGQRALPLTAAQRKMVEQGERFKAAGLADTRLCTLRVCGLMTLYRTTEENSAEIETEKAAEIEDQDVGGVEVQAPEDEIPVNRPEEETDGMPQDADAASEAEPGLDPADTLDEGSPADGADSGDDPVCRYGGE